MEGGTGLPVIDGKHIQPFCADPLRARYRVPAQVANRLAGTRSSHRRARLAYRDVASPTNRLTLIAAIVPAGVMTTHTLFCAKEPLEEELQLFLCGMLNSFVANYLVRLQVGTHVTASLMSRLPVPRVSRESAAFRTIVSCVETLRSSPADAAVHARLQACAAAAVWPESRTVRARTGDISAREHRGTSGGSVSFLRYSFVIAIPDGTLFSPFLDGLRS